MNSLKNVLFKNHIEKYFLKKQYTFILLTMGGYFVLVKLLLNIYIQLQ